MLANLADKEVREPSFHNACGGTELLDKGLRVVLDPYYILS